jgi:hypothetical protein
MTLCTGYLNNWSYSKWRYYCHCLKNVSNRVISLKWRTTKQTPRLQSTSELYRPSDCRLSAKLVPTLADRECRVVSAMNSHGHLFRFSRPEALLFFQVARQLSSRGCVDPVPDPLLLRKSDSAENPTRDLWICSQELWPLDHRGGPKVEKVLKFTFF